MSDPNQPCDPSDLTSPGLSVAREKVLEQGFVSKLAVLMLKRGAGMDVLRSEFDAHGHDIVLEAAGYIRHVQLKASAQGGARRHVDINIKLRAKPSGCVVWLSYDPATLAVTGYRWFGGLPGEPLPDLGQKVTRHSKSDMAGIKALRPALRNLPKSKFELIDDLNALADRLFGPARSLATSLVLAQLRQQFGARWRLVVAYLAASTGFLQSVELAHLIDGYKVLEQLCELDPPGWAERMADEARSGRFSTDFGLLWTQIFIEHRRWRFASPAEPEGDEAAWLDELARRLVSAVDTELRPAAVYNSPLP